jgi:hypothetical protein
MCPSWRGISLVSSLRSRTIDVTAFLSPLPAFPGTPHQSLHRSRCAAVCIGGSPASREAGERWRLDKCCCCPWYSRPLDREKTECMQLATVSRTESTATERSLASMSFIRSSISTHTGYGPSLRRAWCSARQRPSRLRSQSCAGRPESRVSNPRPHPERHSARGPR